MTDLFEQLSKEFVQHGIRSETYVSLASLTTYGVGGKAQLAAWASSAEEVQRIADIVSTHSELDVVVVGRGSNLLIADTGFRGLAVILSAPVAQAAISVEGDVVVAPGTMTMPVLARRSAAAGRGGLEWCVGIPGTVGGAVRMNAGGHGAEMVDSLVSAQVISLLSARAVEVNASDLGLHFRGSVLGRHHVVVSARLKTHDVSAEVANKEIDEIVSWRREHQPGGRNAGSVFVNPAQGDGSAGALIDAIGLRGFAVGGAHVSEKHANFIQASESATADDIVAVMTHVQEEVEKRHGIRLRSEVQLVGFDANIAQRFADPRHADTERVAAAQHLVSLLGDAS